MRSLLTISAFAKRHDSFEVLVTTDAALGIACCTVFVDGPTSSTRLRNVLHALLLNLDRSAGKRDRDMNDRTLGRLTPVKLRDIWSSEASDFTPWLAREENLSILGEVLGVEIEAQERAVGPFRADILCKEIGSGTWVLIENQLERSDHLHLGQLLTYASGLEAVTIVWIVARFTEEHRSTLDWLNRITDESFRFFGLEVELWRIGESPAAPKFNIVSKPNNWSRSVAQAARTIDDSKLSPIAVMQRAYWDALHVVLNEVSGPVSGNRKAQSQSWMEYAIGTAGFALGAVMVRTKRRLRSELYLSGPKAKVFFHLLREGKEDIEQDLGYPLDWQELPTGTDSRIAVHLDDIDPGDTSDWPSQHEWFASKLNDLHRVFARRIRELNPNDWDPESGTGRG